MAEALPNEEALPAVAGPAAAADVPGPAGEVLAPQPLSPPPDLHESAHSPAPKLEDLQPSTETAASTATANSEPTDTPRAPQTSSKAKKRLTLQERLALAAKGKAKKGLEAGSETPTPERSRTPESTYDGKQPAASRSDQDATSTLENHVAQLQNKITELTKENEALKANSNNQAIAKKDELINQLMKEGEQLSIKELKLNETVKKLKNSNAELEEVVNELNGKIEESLIKINELDELLKFHKLKSLDSLRQKLHEISELEIKVNSTTEIDQKFKEQVKLYEKELDLKNQRVKELNDLTIQFDLLKQNHLLELNLKDEFINRLKFENSSLKSEYQSEIFRLENKIEALRTEHENDGPTRSFDNGGISNDEFLKLSNNHSNLQAEYLRSQENWKLIESNLNTKIDNLNSVIDNFKSTKINLINENKQLKHTTSAQQKEINAFRDKVDTMSKGLDDLKLQVKLHVSEKEELSEKLNSINTIFFKEKQTLNTTINQLQEKIDKFRNDSISENLSHLDEIKFNESLFEQPPSLRTSQSFINEEFDDSSFDDSDTSKLPTPSAYVNSNFQLINKMTNNIKRLEVELNSLREENASLTKSKEKLQNDIVKFLDMSAEHSELLDKQEELKMKLSAKEKAEQDLLELIGEKEERVDELTNDVQDLKDLVKLQVQQLMEIQEKFGK